MSDRSLRVALAQINATVGDLAGNRMRIECAVRLAEAEGAHVALFPELALTGYPPEDLLLKKRFVDDNLRALAELAHSCRGTAAVVGFVDRRGSALYNAAAVLSNGRVNAVYRKAELPNYGVFDEKRYFRAGSRPVVARVGGPRAGVTICEDIWVPASAANRRVTFRNADAVLNLSASPFHRGKHRSRESLVASWARRVGKPVAYVNLVGGQDELVFDGGSLAFDARGRVLARCGRFQEDFRVVELVTKGRPAQGAAAPSLGPIEEVYEALVLGTRDYLHKNGFSKAAIGLSGGIDSAIVACIAADALGPENVVAVTMPSRYTSRATLIDARKTAANLGLELHELPIGAAFRAHLATLKPVFGNRPQGLTEENLQARIRGTLLMALSNKFGHLVLATSNKSETATGYSTLYGDMAGGFAPIKDVPKTLVYELSRYRNRRGPGSPIPPSTIRRAPSAELRPGQKDTDSLPPYPVLDRFLEGYVEHDLDLDRIVSGGVPPKVARESARRVDSSEYKRRQAAPGIKITPKAFGRDRRMPITNRYTP